MSKLNLFKIKPHFNVSFYNEYREKILNEFRFNNKISNIYGFYEQNNISNLFFEDYSFNLNKLNITSGKIYFLNGILYHCATLEAFETLNEEDLNEISNKFIDNKENIFIIICFMDLKKYSFRYQYYTIDDLFEFKINKISSSNNSNLNDNHHIHKNTNKVLFPGFDILENNEIIVYDIFTNNDKISNIYKLILNRYVIDKFQNELSISIIIDKDNNNSLTLNTSNLSSSSLSSMNILLKSFISKKNKEHNKENENYIISLNSIFDIKQIAEESVELNLNLMKWRMEPDLNLNQIKNKKVLIIGAGTLGCNVSRVLLGWGIKNISFIDSGSISYSNPVRQSLFNFNDTINNYNKAEKAAEKLKEIFPSVNSKGYNIHIPYPGLGYFNEESKNKILDNIENIEKLIIEHDSIFLLTDSRESRWLPTVICKRYNKTCITAAIGYDSFVIINHSSILKDNHNNITNISACYFCNDIISPIDTSKNRTLDMQCTISRPGISSICSGLAVELFINDIECMSKETKMPNSLRGNINTFEIIQINSASFSKCIACSDNIIKEFKENKISFLLNSLSNPSYLELISGIKDMFTKEFQLVSNEEDDNEGFEIYT